MVRGASMMARDLAFAASPDVLPLVEAEVLARALARWEPSDAASKVLADEAAKTRAGQEFLEFYGIGDARLWDPRTLWGQMTAMSPNRLRVPLGKNPTTGKVVWLDMKEGAQDGHGPHGLMTGVTGSGKSESLTSLILSLTMLNPPELLQLLLGDFKGESAMGVLAGLPHVQGLVSNLAESQHRLNRFEHTVLGEVQRRQVVLNKTGYGSVRDYEIARATTRPDLEPIGALLIVLDEFSELLRRRPEMAQVFDTVGLQGRSLWIHILSASQRVEAGKMAGLIAQQTYSIGLKVKDATQSRAAIGSNRAYEDLKGAPEGTGFLVVDDAHQRFRSFYVSGEFIAPKARGDRGRRSEGQVIEAHRFGAGVRALPLDITVDNDGEQALGAPAEKTDAGVDAPRVVTVLAQRIVEAGRGRAPGHRLWLPPLEEIAQIPIDEMALEFWGHDWRDVRDNSGLVIPIGRGDDPFAHTQELVSVDLSGAGGHVGIAGATQSGKSTVIRTLVAMLSVSHSPQRVQFYAIDLGGGKLKSMGPLPHVAAVAGQGEDEKMRRILATVERLLESRIRTWGQAGIDLAEFRARKFRGKAGEVPEDAHGDVFLIVDNLRVLYESADDLHARVATLAESALNYGIHLIITNDNWIAIRPQISNKLGTRIELRMADPNETMMKDRPAAADIPAEQPGRALQFGGKHLLIGAPVVGGRALVGVEGEQDSSEQQSVEDTATEIAGIWAGRGAQAVHMATLPTQIAYADLGPVPADTLKLGIGDKEMAAVGVNLVEAPHFFAAGTSGSGRTTVLRTLLRSIMDTYTPDEAQVVLFDPNLGLADAIDPSYLSAYASTMAEVGGACAALVERLDQRRPPTGLPIHELAQWRFTGRRVFVVIDDMNLLATPPLMVNDAGLHTLVPVVERARQVGLHVLAATSVNNWFRVESSKPMQAMATAGTGALVMDGPKDKIFEDVRGAPRIPGRGELVYRKSGSQLIQVATPPHHTVAAGPQQPGLP